jgi:hypothetical protein
MTFTSLLKKPSAVIPLVISVAALSPWSQGRLRVWR